MCGILGSINIPFDESLLDAIKHRGPDDFGIESFTVNESIVTLGHRRLSILDLSSSGHQPMISQCRNYIIIFNGEIYNHLELRAKLTNTINFKGHSDTETILYYIMEFGIDSIKNLNGIFGLAYLDIPNNCLYLARDRFGVKPLYYYHDSDKLIFSSELGPFKRKLDLSIDLGSLGSCLKMRYFAAPTTPFKDILKLESGQLIKVKINSESIFVEKSYFVDNSAKLGTPKNKNVSLVQAYGDLFEKAVERQLMSDVDVGVLLSGGIDSALIAAVAKAKSKKKLKAFTVGFSERFSGINESIYAQETAQLLGLDHYIKECEFPDFFGSIKRIVNIVEEPVGTTSIVPMFFLAELASSRVKVVLSGQGADEPLGGYFKYKGLPLMNLIRKSKKLSDLFRAIEPYCQNAEHVRRLVGGICAEDQIKSYIEFSAISSIEEIYRILNPNYSKSFLREINSKQRQHYEVLVNRVPEYANINSIFPYYDLRTSLSDDLLMYTDKVTMHFGMECRVPILDNDLIEFIETLPASKKYNTFNSKIIHRLFSREYLPSSIIERKKMGFKSPSAYWFREHSLEILSILNSNQSFKKLFSIDKVNDLIQVHSKGTNLEKQIFLLLSIAYLLEEIEETEDLLTITPFFI